MSKPVLNDPDNPKPPSEHAALHAHLQSKFGLTPAQTAAIIGANVAGRTRRQIEQAVTAWAKTLPKGA